MTNRIAVVGAGLAGSECAWVLAEGYGLEVTLFEMKTKKQTPAQIAPHLFAELVCSNSLKSTSRLNPAGLLKEELTALGSLVVRAAREAQVPAGESLAVDRERFSGAITRTLRTHPRITVRDEIVTSVKALEDEGFAAIVLATGPLTDDALAEDLRARTGSESLYFYDAIAPILDGDTIDLNIAFFANRAMRSKDFEKRTGITSDVFAPSEAKSVPSQPPQESKESTEGTPHDNDVAAAEEEEAHYLNLPLNKEEYLRFVEEVVAGEKVPFHAFEEPRFFNGCQPIEVLAESGPRTLSFGPMKARGLTDPRTGRFPYAAVQLRRENLGHSAYNMVGFQTRLTWTAQKRILRTLPGLAEAEFHRFGSMHRNTYLVSPALLATDFSLKTAPHVFLAGQLMGVEGYLESAAMGVLVGHVIGMRLAKGESLALPPANTSLGSLARHTLFAEAKHYTPMNIHWGLFDDLTPADIEAHVGDDAVLADTIKRGRKMDKSVKRLLLSRRASALSATWLAQERPAQF